MLEQKTPGAQSFRIEPALCDELAAAGFTN